MKNLICTLLLVFGAFLSVQAQTLNVTLVNNTKNEAWAFGVNMDANDYANHIQVDANPLSTTMGFANGPVLQLLCRAGEPATGCSDNWNVQLGGSSFGSQNICGNMVDWVCIFSPFTGYSITVTVNP
jgi:hypothetical protein